MFIFYNLIKKKLPWILILKLFFFFLFFFFEMLIKYTQYFDTVVSLLLSFSFSGLQMLGNLLFLSFNSMIVVGGEH